MPAASSLTRASRSISDERSMPIAWPRAGANSSIIRPVPVPMSTQPRRAAGRRARGRSPARPRFRRHAASGSSPRPRHGPRNSARAASARSARTASSRAASAANSASVAASAQRSISANIGSVRSGSASVRNTQLPSLRRSTTPASARILRWRETRGWLWPSTCASSPTDSSMVRSSARMRSRVGSASAWKRSASWRSGSPDKDIKISLYPSIEDGARAKTILAVPQQMTIA